MLLKNIAITIICSALNLLPISSFSQVSSREFTPGFYIINSSAKFAIVQNGGKDFYEENKECFRPYENLTMASGEVVIAYELFKGVYYCFDPNGRMVAFIGQDCLTKAPIVEGSGVGLMNETIPLIDGEEIREGAYYWIIGQNTINSTVKIQVADGKTYDIPQNKITLHGVSLKKSINTIIFSRVI